MAKYRCTVCNYIFDEEKEGYKFDELPDNWRCPVCNSPKSTFVLLSEEITVVKEGESTVSDVLVTQMVEWGVQYVFGIPGTSSLGVVDAVRKNKNVNYVQVRHEQTAAFMASAYGKLTGHPAACLTVAGPGATNLATGLYDASLDHSPVLALTGMLKRQLIGPGSFQEIEQQAFFEPITVYDKVLMSEDQTTTLITKALKHAILDKGVAHIGIPKDVQEIPLAVDTIPFEGSFPNNAITQPMFLILQAAQAINQSKRPVIVSGFGGITQGDNILELAEKITAPIVTTFRGKGVIDEDNEYSVGCHGDIGSTASSELVLNSDLLIVVGSSFSEMTHLPEKKAIQIDIDPLVIGKQYPVEVGLYGNSAEVLPQLLDLVQENKKDDYLAEIRKLKQDWVDLLKEEADASLTPIRPQYIIKVLNEKVDDDAVITIDTGENGWWFGRNFWMKRTQKMVMSGYLGTMGIGLPAALTAQLIYPDRQVVCITGDGGFSMVMADFTTAVRNELPVKIFIFNNHQLGMIMQEQMVEKYPNWETELYNPDFAAFARDCGGVGINVKNPQELPEAVDQALKADKPVIVDIETDPQRFIEME